MDHSGSDATQAGHAENHSEWPRSLLIVGCGLLGGSLALAQRRIAPGTRLYIADMDCRRSAIHEKIPEAEWCALEQISDLKQLAEEVDLTVIATPVRYIADWVELLLSAKTSLIDLGSTKANISQKLAEHPARSRYLPSHPMSGLPSGGVENACADLFEGNRWLICPEKSDASLISLCENWLQKLGSSVMRISTEEHDRAVAYTSHLPQLISTTLLRIAGEEEIRQTGGPGFRSMTRVAGGPSEIWQDIFTSNRSATAEALQRFIAELQECQRALSEEDLGTIPQMLSEARDIKSRPSGH